MQDCPVCARDISALDANRRATHVSRCLQKKEKSSQNITITEDEAISATQDTRLADAQAYACPQCGQDLSKRLLRARIAHLKKCDEARRHAQPLPAARDQHQQAKLGLTSSLHITSDINRAGNMTLIRHNSNAGKAADVSATVVRERALEPPVSKRRRLQFGTVGAVDSSRCKEREDVGCRENMLPGEVQDQSCVAPTTTGRRRTQSVTSPVRPNTNAASRQRLRRGANAVMESDEHDEELQMALAVSRSLVETRAPIVSPIKTPRASLRSAARVLVRTVEEHARAEVETVVDRLPAGDVLSGRAMSALERIYKPRTYAGMCLAAVHTPKARSPHRAVKPVRNTATRTSGTDATYRIDSNAQSHASFSGSQQQDGELQASPFPEADALVEIFMKGAEDMRLAYRRTLDVRRLEYEAAQQHLRKAFECDVEAMRAECRHRIEELRSLCCMPVLAAAEQMDLAYDEFNSPMRGKDASAERNLRSEKNADTAINTTTTATAADAQEGWEKGIDELDGDESSVAALETVLGIF